MNEEKRKERLNEKERKGVRIGDAGGGDWVFW